MPTINIFPVLARALALGGAYESLELVGVPYRDIDDACSGTRGPLLRRYYLLFEPARHVYLHHLLRSDDDRHFHDHPWSFSTFLLTGAYIEHTPDGATRQPQGAFLERPAIWRHWLELEQPVWTLVITGPYERDWGFWTPTGFVSHRNYAAAGCE